MGRGSGRTKKRRERKKKKKKKLKQKKANKEKAMTVFGYDTAVSVLPINVHCWIHDHRYSYTSHTSPDLSLFLSSLQLHFIIVFSALNSPS